MDESRYTDWVLRYTLMQNLVFSSGDGYKQLLILLDD